MSKWSLLSVPPSPVCLSFTLILNQIKLNDFLAWFYCRCYCCMWIPFILDGLKNVIHTCPKCGSKLGEYTRFRMDRIWQKKKKHRQTQHNYTRGWQKKVWGRRYPGLWFDTKVQDIIIIWKMGIRRSSWPCLMNTCTRVCSWKASYFEKRKYWRKTTLRSDNRTV